MGTQDSIDAGVACDAPGLEVVHQGTDSNSRYSADVQSVYARDTVDIFMRSCAGIHVEWMPACRCVIDGTMRQMTHEEFMQLSTTGGIEKDPRMANLRLQCATQPQKRS